MDAEALSALIDATWPSASTEVRGGWRIRHDPAGGNRVSASTALIKGHMTLTDAPLYMVRPGEEELDALLAVKGFKRKDPTLVMTARCGDIAADVPRDAVLFCDHAPALLREIWGEGGIGPGRLAIMHRAKAPKTILLGRHKDRAAAAAFLAVHETTAMLHALHVAPTARRTGLARRMMQGAAAWAILHGAQTFAVLVTEANGPAQALYQGLGFETVARYHYRKRPEKP
ncbi:MAG: GNAT family N-acetyltransferase [Pseudomonadota bacterium]